MKCRPPITEGETVYTGFVDETAIDPERCRDIRTGEFWFVPVAQPARVERVLLAGQNAKRRKYARVDRAGVKRARKAARRNRR